MPSHLHVTAHVLTVIFLIGVAGCAVSIPMIAWKFASVLFEKDGEDGEDEPRTGGRASQKSQRASSKEDSGDDENTKDDKNVQPPK